MVDKVKALKLEDTTSGTDFDMIPTETDPTEDYLSAKGLALENDDATRVEKVAGEVAFIDATNGTKKVSDLLDADQEDFDPTGTDLTSVKTGPAVREVRNLVSSSASPGFSWGSGGNVTTNTWLSNEGVPSNKAGRTVTFSSPEIVKIFTASENLNTYTISVYEHEGDEINLTLLTTLVISASRTGDSGTIAVAMTSGRQLALKVTSGSAKNLIAGIVLTGQA